MSGQIGVLAPGAYADIIAVPGDPLKDIKNLGNVQFVMKDGKVFKDEAGALARREESSGSEDASDGRRGAASRSPH